MGASEGSEMAVVIMQVVWCVQTCQAAGEGERDASPHITRVSVALGARSLRSPAVDATASRLPHLFRSCVNAAVIASLSMLLSLE